MCCTWLSTSVCLLFLQVFFVTFSTGLQHTSNRPCIFLSIYSYTLVFGYDCKCFFSSPVYLSVAVYSILYLYLVYLYKIYLFFNSRYGFPLSLQFSSCFGGFLGIQSCYLSIASVLPYSFSFYASFFNLV